MTICGIFFEDDITSNNNSLIDDKITYALKTSRFIIIALHEFNHYIYSYILHLNNYIHITFDSPRKKELREFSNLSPHPNRVLPSLEKSKSQSAGLKK